MKMKGISSVLTIAITTVFWISLNIFHTEAVMTVEQIQNMVKPLGKSCASKVGLSPELQEAHRNGQFPEDRTLMCYLHCLGKLTKNIDKNNNIDVEGKIKQLKMALPEELIPSSINAYNTCFLKATSEDPCEKSYQFAKCYYETDAKTYFFP
ncbi:general odorant-binding protein lush-like [Microplitis mediator]|uniref:general odorant-binding protein lush-like n=1 Tax=Microplitis mediator TaxID=375433 RepID=UPI0025579C3D|nr:general odorant-binding protein lush-like [Microplitis mediator]